MKNTQISKMYKYSPFRDLGTHSNTLKKLLKEQDGLLKMIDPYLPLDGGISHFSKALFLSLFSKKPEKEMATHSVFLPGESQGQESLVGCHLWGRTESDMTEAT